MRQVNLLPEDLQTSQYQKRIARSVLLTGGSTLLVMAVLHVLIALGVAGLEDRVRRPQTYADAAEFVELREQVRILKDDVSQYVGRYRTVIEAYMDHYATTAILKTLGKAGRQKIWLTRLTVNNTTRVCDMEGRSFNTRLVSEFMLGIKKNPFFDNITPISMEKGPEQIIHFRITCDLK